MGPSIPGRGALVTAGGARRLSVLWVNHYAVAPGDGGGTRHAELGRELVKRGWEVTVVSSDFNLHSRQYGRRAGPDAREAIREMVDGVEFRWLWASPYRRNDWRRFRNWTSFASSVRAIRDLRPSVVVGSSPDLFAAWGASVLARRLDVPFVLEVRDLWPESILAGGGRKGPLYWGLEAVARLLYRRASRIIVLARGVGTALTRRGIATERIGYVPNGVDLEAFEAAGPPGGGATTFVYTGAHGPMNGLEAVLEAAELLRGEPSIRFLLVGDGPIKQRLVEMARSRGLDNVEFRPPVPKRSIPALLRTVDAGLMVLKPAELFEYGVSPNKLFDYFAAGLPVVCNVPGDVERMVEEAGAGFQAVAGSGPSLAEAVRRMAALTPAERAGFGRSAREWVARDHGRLPLAERLDKELRQVVGSSGDRRAGEAASVRGAATS